MDQPNEVFAEHDYLVSRGVRPLAIVGQCPSDPLIMLKIATRIEAAASPNVIPFVVERKDGFAEYGYAASAWVLDLYKWLITSHTDAVSPKQQNRFWDFYWAIVSKQLGYLKSVMRGALFIFLSSSSN